MKKLIPILAIGCAALSVQAAISINFTASSAPFGFGPFYILGPEEVAGVSATTGWTNLTGLAGTYENLASTTLDVTVSASGGAGLGHWGFYGASGGDRRMLGGFLENPFGTITLDLAEIPVAAYDLILYVGPNADRINTGWNATLGTTTLYGKVGDPSLLPPETFMEATATTPDAAVVSNYVRFNGLSGATQSLSVSGVGVSISGFQLVAVPEPSNYAVSAAILVLGFTFLRRRQ